MNAKLPEADRSVENRKKGTVSGQLTPVSPFPGAADSGEKGLGYKGRAAKSSVEYWKRRIRPRTYRDAQGRECETPELYIRIKQRGKDQWICLDTANRAEGAAKARDIWARVQVIGLEKLMGERRPALPDRVATIGELIAVVETHAQVRPRTLTQYTTALRRVVSGVMKIEASVGRYAAGSDANADWRAKIDRVRLDQITPSAVEAWRGVSIAAASDEQARQSRSHSTSSNIRNCRALFSKALLVVLREKLKLPAVLPFEGLTAGSTTRRFESKVNPKVLYKAAWMEFAATPDTLAAFLLLIAGGLRRGEADLLPWSAIDFKKGTVRVTTTKWFTPKTREAERETKLPKDVLGMLARQQRATPEAEFILAGLPPKAPGKIYEYRASAWEPLTIWLKAKGFESPNPLHELRKMSGSLANEIGGLEAARRHLGHANITTTSASYVQAPEVVINLARK